MWRSILDQTPSQIRTLQQNLAADEQARAERFYFARDRGHFIVARGVLRAILGRYLSRAPERLSFCYGSHGKPALADAFDGNAIRFNLSHSHGVALYAVTRGREVGIDLERIRSDLAARRSPSGFSRDRKLRCFERSRPSCSIRRSFAVGRARRPTSRPGAKDFRCPWTSLTCRWVPGNRGICSAQDPILPKPRVGLFRNLPPPLAMQPLLPWKDTTGVLPVGNGRTRGSHQFECRDARLFAAPISRRAV